MVDKKQEHLRVIEDSLDQTFNIYNNFEML